MDDKRITVEFSVKTVFIAALSLIFIWLIYFLKDVLVLFIIAFIFATALEPAVDWFQAKKIPRWVGILFIYLLVSLVIYTLIRLIIPPVTNQINQLVENRQMIAKRVTEYISHTPETVKKPVFDFAARFPERVTTFSSANAFDSALGIFSGLFGAFTVFVVTFYLLLEKGTMEGVIDDFWPSRSKEKASLIFRKIALKINLWLRAQLILSTAIGLLIFIGLTFLRVDYALTLALFAALTELLPLIGPYIGAIPAVIVAFTISPLTALWVLILYIGIQNFESHVLIPNVMKRAVGLSPVAIIFALLVGAKLLGILGLLMAVPVASAVAILIEEYKKREQK